MEKVTVSKEKCLGCLYGTSGVCEMYDEIAKPMEGDVCSNYAQDFDVVWHIAEKMRYNTFRQRKHGKKY